MRSSRTDTRPVPVLLPLALLGAALLAGCSSGGGDSDVNTSFKLKNTPHGVAGTTPLLLYKRWLVYLADEASTGAGGTDLNADGDVVDSVPVVVNTVSNAKQVIPVAVDRLGPPPEETIAFINGTLFMVVDEAEDAGSPNADWNGDADTNDIVVLYMMIGDALPTYADTLYNDPAAQPTPAHYAAIVGNRVFYKSATAPTMDFETDIYMSEVVTPGVAPTLPVMVASDVDDVANDGLSLTLHAEDSGIVFLTADEVVEAEDLNLDADMLDTAILLLLDGTVNNGMALTTELAIAPTTPVAAGARMNDFLVAFLVNETDQGVNLNDPALFGGTWPPASCAGLGDIDMLDHVLHWLPFADWSMDKVTNPPVNTGLVGTLGERVYVHEQDFVGVASLESDEGDMGGCDLNVDGDVLDRVFRWTNLSDPAVPVTNPDLLLALTASVPGAPSADSTGGVVVIDDFWVLLVDEAADGRDHDMDGNMTHKVVGVRDPAYAGPDWNFDVADQPPALYAGATWMAQNPFSTSNFFMALDEAVLGLDRNLDGDTNDSVLTLPEARNATQLKLPGFGVGLAEDNAGIVTARGFAFYRVSEAAEKKDLNGDGDKADFLLQRIGVTVGDPPAYMGTLNDQPRSAAAFDMVFTPEAGAFLYDETMQGAAGKDLNNDGDRTDLVVRYFRLP